MIHGRDNVAVALRTLVAESDVQVAVEGRMIRRRILQGIPSGHKFALVPIGRGDEVIKYGEAIGVAILPIRVGEHVHIHNVLSQRGRGDLNAK